MQLSKGRSGSLLARLTYLIGTSLLIGILHSQIVSAVPMPQEGEADSSIDDPDWNDNIPGGGGGPFSTDPSTLVDNYPDLEQCRSKCTVGKDLSLFYSKVGKHEDKPQKFANENSLTMVREAYPSGFTDKNDKFTGFTKFAIRFSTAFAEKTSGTAYAMLPTDGTDISKSVWTKYEKLALVASAGSCDRIIKVDPDKFSSRCILWDRKGEKDDKMPNCDKETGPIPAPPAATDIPFGGSPPPPLQSEPATPPPAEVKPANPPAPPKCAPVPDGGVKDAHEGKLKRVADSFCRRFAADTVMGPDVDIKHALLATYAFGGRGLSVPVVQDYKGDKNMDDVYDVSITSVRDCPMPNEGFNLDEPVMGHKCSDILYHAWKDCNNQGRGGTIQAGCLDYGILTVY